MSAADKPAGLRALADFYEKPPGDFQCAPFALVPSLRAAAQRIEERAEMLAALKAAVGHLDHMAAWIGKQNAGYSFESLGEDMPGMRDAIAKAEGR